MQSTVAVVLVRPETILDDYRRVMELAGIDASLFDDRPALFASRDRSGWFPGAGTPPWQLEGVLRVLEGTRPGCDVGTGPDTTDSGNSLGQWDVVALDLNGGGFLDSTGGWAWEGVLARNSAVQACPSGWVDYPVHPQRPMPSLASALPGGLVLPSPLQGRPVLLMPVLRILSGWPLAGSVAMLQGLHGNLRRKLQAPLSEVRAECVALAQEVFPVMGAVMDATLWGVSRGGESQSVARNVLLAGTDPVAVDAVAARLAGFEPRNIPWLRLCGERKLGAVSKSDISLVGSRELQDLDFQVSAATLGSKGTSLLEMPGGGWFWRTFRKPRILKKHRGSPWGRLFQEYSENRSGPAESGI
ncbi:MAG: DUF362 domain-containing protein [Gemmatimonadales bacterium]|nr:DUF362 domain-containing protein [Gemmatimonadales bacterium]